MGYRGKLAEQQQARSLRARSWTLSEIADELGVSTSSVSLWVRDVDFIPRPRSRGHPTQAPHPMKVKKQAQIEQCRQEAAEWVGDLGERALEMFALGLYAGEGTKGGGAVKFANSDPALMALFATWLRRAFDIDERRLRVALYLHADLDVDAAIAFWSGVTAVPPEQFRKPYRAVVDDTMRHNRHVHGCAAIVYCCTLTHRRVMARIRAVASSSDLPG